MLGMRSECARFTVLDISRAHGEYLELYEG
jgi:hypothetical protein